MRTNLPVRVQLDPFVVFGVFLDLYYTSCQQRGIRAPIHAPEFWSILHAGCAEKVLVLCALHLHWYACGLRYDVHGSFVLVASVRRIGAISLEAEEDMSRSRREVETRIVGAIRQGSFQRCCATVGTKI